MPSIRTHNLGHPRFGEHRELKKATELYWKGNLSREELEVTGRQAAPPELAQATSRRDRPHSLQ